MLFEKKNRNSEFRIATIQKCKQIEIPQRIREKEREQH